MGYKSTNLNLGDRYMNETFSEKVQEIMNERFRHDTLIALATINGNFPSVRTVDAYYENGAFYIITYALSNKIKQIEILRMDNTKKEAVNIASFFFCCGSAVTGGTKAV